MTTLPTRRSRAAGVLAAITMTAVLAACSSGGDDAGSADVASGGSSESGAAYDADGGDSAGSAEAPTERSADGLVADDVDGAAGPDTPQMERSVISSGTVSLSSKDVAGTRREVQRIVDAQGGEVTEESTETDEKGRTSYARLVVRVPSTKFSTAMEALEETGALRSSNRGSDDVTTQVIDTDVRVRAQQASLKRVELLLAEAGSLKDIIWIESQLTQRQSELDSLKSQQSWLADQTALSTITVDISTEPVVEKEPDEDEPAGFLAGLKGGMSALGGTAVAVATIVGALLPFAVVALVVGLPLWLVVRRRRTTPVPQPAGPES